MELKFLAKNYDKENFEKLGIIRFLDDWAYQANIRQKLSRPNIEELTNDMKKFEEIIEGIYNQKINAKYKFPWNRLFEVEVELN